MDRQKVGPIPHKPHTVGSGSKCGVIIARSAPALLGHHGAHRGAPADCAADCAPTYVTALGSHHLSSRHSPITESEPTLIIDPRFEPTLRQAFFQEIKPRIDPMSNVSNQRARNWTFTKNNYTRDELHRLRELIDDGAVKYICWGYEVAPTTGTKHLQGYVSFHKQIRGKQVLKYKLGHIQVAKGSPAQNKTYCSKEETKDPDEPIKFEEFGDIPRGQGTRSDLESVVEMVRSGKRVRDIAESAGPVYVKYYRGIERLIDVQTNPNREQPDLVYVWGVARSGKSMFAKIEAAAKFDEHQIYFKPAGKWWPMYNQEKCVIFNDFTSADMSLREWCRVFDHVPHYVEVKGSNVPVTFEQAIVTSNFPPLLLWPGVSEGRRMAALRRINLCLFFWQDLRDPYCPTNTILHDPFQIPAEAHDWMRNMETQQDLLELGARNHREQLL